MAHEDVVFTAEQLAEMQAIPSRPCLEGWFADLPRYTADDPCPSHEKRCRNAQNPFYNAKMDPGSDRWDKYTYFKAQPQVEVFVYPDPESPDVEVFGMSINGFQLPCYPNKRQKMPRDFVDLLKQRNHQFDVLASGLVSRDENEEGSLSLTVSGSRPKPFIRRIAD
jgi:hypothetical protein